MSYHYKIITINGIKGRFIEESSADGDAQVWNLSIFSDIKTKPSLLAFERAFEWLKNNHPEEII